MTRKVAKSVLTACIRRASGNPEKSSPVTPVYDARYLLIMRDRAKAGITRPLQILHILEDGDVLKD